jgi:hypothetical protein
MLQVSQQVIVTLNFVITNRYACTIVKRDDIPSDGDNGFTHEILDCEFAEPVLCHVMLFMQY